MTSRAGDRARTGDVQLGKLAFYQLNYARVILKIRDAARTINIHRASSTSRNRLRHVYDD